MHWCMDKCRAWSDDAWSLSFMEESVSSSSNAFQLLICKPTTSTPSLSSRRSSLGWCIAITNHHSFATFDVAVSSSSLIGMQPRMNLRHHNYNPCWAMMWLLMMRYLLAYVCTISLLLLFCFEKQGCGMRLAASRAQCALKKTLALRTKLLDRNALARQLMSPPPDWMPDVTKNQAANEQGR